MIDIKEAPVSPVLRFFAALALLPFAAPAAGMPSTPIRIGLHVSSENHVPASVLAAFRQETALLLDIHPLEILWHGPENPINGQTFDRLIMIRLAGTCSTHAQTPDPPHPGPLGITHISDGHILPFVEADCGRILLAATRLRNHPFRLSAHNFGRALARVIAHEIGHVLSESEEHDHHGLSKASLSPAELFLPGIAFPAAARARILASLVSPDLLAAVEPPTRPVP
ncbi:MAG TPA: hypothetical protein DCY80_10315 [Solibacterales bacterium]|nr:hypothetical protein [Bryobacterales bacterium]